MAQSIKTARPHKAERPTSESEALNYSQKRCWRAMISGK